MEIPRKLGMHPPFEPAILVLDLYSKDLKSVYYSKSATLMFIVA